MVSKRLSVCLMPYAKCFGWQPSELLAATKTTGQIWVTAQVQRSVPIFDCLEHALPLSNVAADTDADADADADWYWHCPCSAVVVVVNVGCQFCQAA